MSRKVEAARALVLAMKRMEAEESEDVADAIFGAMVELIAAGEEADAVELAPAMVDVEADRARQVEERRAKDAELAAAREAARQEAQP